MKKFLSMSLVSVVVAAIILTPLPLKSGIIKTLDHGINSTSVAFDHGINNKSITITAQSTSV